MREEKSKSGKVKMRNKALFIGIIGIVAIVLAVAAIGANANISTEASDKVNVPDVPHKINYQGYLTDAADNPITGDRDMTFGIYDSHTGGTPLWSETQTSVHVEKGLFNVILGSVNPIPGDVFPSGGSRWLETAIEGQTLTPRKEIVSVAYALKADPDNDWDDAGTGMMYTHYLGDSVGIGVTDPDHHLEVRGGAARSGALLVEDNNLADFTGAMLEFNGGNRDGFVNIFAGTWDDPYIEGGRPVIKLHPSTQGNNRVILMVDDYDFQKFKIRTQGIYGDTMEERMRDTGGKDVLTITQDGNAGIGTTGPQEKLHVIGNIKSGTGIIIDGVNNQIRADQGRLSFIEESGAPPLLVGIGTPTPGRKLHLSALGAGPGEATLRLENTHPAGDPWDLKPTLWNDGGASSSFGIKDVATNVLAVAITEDGQVGIGTPTPAAKLHVVGNLLVTGSKKFVQAHPTDPTKEIVYVSLEGPEAGTYIRGTAQLVNGEAVINLPEHFSLVTSDEGLTVQLTPAGEWLQLYVVEKGTQRIIIHEANDKNGQFDYLVQGVRKGYENHQVIGDKE
jgi:hypothetical protein